MDTLLQKYQNSFERHHLSSYSDNQLDFPCGFSDVVSNITSLNGGQGGSDPVEADYFDGVFKYIDHMLNEEEEFDYRPFMFHDCLALQAAEKSFYDVLNQENPPPPSSGMRSHIPTYVSNLDTGTRVRIIQESPGLVNDSFHGIFRNQDSYFMDSNNVSGQYFSNFDQVRSQPLLGSFSQNTNQICYASTSLNAPVYSSIDFSTVDKHLADNYQNECLEPFQENLAGAIVSRNNPNNVPSQNMPPGEISFIREKNIHQREDGQNNGDNPEGSRSKQLAGCDEESDEEKQKETYDYDKALLCPKMNPNFYKDKSSKGSNEILRNEDQWKDYSRSAKRGRPKMSDKKNSNKKEVVDLRELLTKCAQAVTISDGKTTGEILKQIRQHSSACGDATERLAHYFADALEARINSTGAAIYSASATRKVASSSILKAYQAYVTACPFKRMSNIFANKSIARQVGKSPSIHIIDFGISYGFQWPCIIHGLSLRPGGPPRLKITGVDFPEPGFRPAERIKKTGERLASFCQRFDVPFEFNAVAKSWDLITLEDLKINGDEKTIVNCLYRLRHVADESLTTEDSPRDQVLELVKKINPDFFVHGVLNGTYNAPFFGTRFRQALFHFSSLFDMFETTVPREDQDRLVYEREFFGREIMNIVASCEGAQRVERPETYKQWQGRIQRAGFKQLPLNREIVKEVIAKVGCSYHRDFLVDEDSDWILQGWKGRVLYAISCWKPINN
ncbi:hypothetical protein LIER_01457 [Lithospermum erythrorhizon]|uniref:Uncharacterized protein n=1 Tax=Lithospermum erythrorhizon TaxID=34254 RepID=A0AAV3NLH2_LITER